MGIEIRPLGDIEIKKWKLLYHKISISIYDVDINKIIVSNKIFLGKKGFKYFIGYEDNDKVTPLCIMLPKMSGYRRNYNETKYMSFLVNENDLLERFNEIWDKFSNTIKKGFDSEPAYNKKYLKTKRKSCEGKINRNFHNDKISKKCPHFICLSVILIDSVFNMGKKYYPYVLLEECKYIVKEKKMTRHITDDLEIFSDDSDESDGV